MQLTIEALKEYWKIKDAIFKKNQKYVDRFDKINNLFDEILDNNNKISIENNQVIIGNSNIDGEYSIEAYGPMSDATAAYGAFEGVRNMCKKFPYHKDVINKIGCLLGGFKFLEDNQNNIIPEMVPAFRIISNIINKKNDNGTLTSKGESRHPSSNFADNNYFFKVMQQIQYYKNNKELDQIFLILRWPGGKYFEPKNVKENQLEELNKNCKNQQEVLKFRFPLKFLWMWANKETIIHPFSLMSFKNLLKIDTDVKKNADLLNCVINEFPEQWKSVSDNICKEILDDGYGENQIKELSKLISIVTVSETDIKNIGDLLETGNKAVILWGVPGTGKTYAAKKLVRDKLLLEKLKENETFEEKYLFSKNFDDSKDDVNDKEHGYFELVQFHPSYSYEDFIGGIKPKLDGNDIAYELKTGIFKRFCDVAKENSTQNFYLIIDEINRAELSAVFGELLYTLEYRNEPINLPYFGEFTIPDNVYIIGTMNNVDKSLVTFDLALRRRFGFYKMEPDIDVLSDIDELNTIFDSEYLDSYIKRCKELNKNIIDTQNGLMLERDYQIGHAYFKKIKDFFDKSSENSIITPLELEKRWCYHLEPLLEEYLGMSIADNDVEIKLKKVKDDFVKPLEIENG